VKVSSFPGNGKKVSGEMKGRTLTKEGKKRPFFPEDIRVAHQTITKWGSSAPPQRLYGSLEKTTKVMI